jgi:hypothetical protein
MIFGPFEVGLFNACIAQRASKRALILSPPSIDPLDYNLHLFIRQTTITTWINDEIALT